MSGLTAFDSSKTKLEKGVTLLEASAGTGKTYALARIFLRLVAEEGVEVGKILTVTFTTAATEELRDRIRSLLVEAHETLLEKPIPGEDPTFSRLRSLAGVDEEECIRRIKLAITCFDEAIISTIHGSATECLRRIHSRPDHYSRRNWTRLPRKWLWKECRSIGGRGLHPLTRWSPPLLPPKA